MRADRAAESPCEQDAEEQSAEDHSHHASALFRRGKVCREGDAPSPMGQNGAGPLAVERWAKGARTSILEELPSNPLPATSAISLSLMTPF